MKANYINTLYHLNATPLIKQKLCGVWAGDFCLSLSLSLSLSLLTLVACLCVKFKRLFYSFCRSFISFHRRFFLFYRSFNSSFCLQKAFCRALCFFKIFKHFVFGLFAFVIASRFLKNGVAIHKFSVTFAL